MAQAKQKRDNEYYLERLRIEHPDLHADFQAGRVKNLSHALKMAGLRKQRSNLDVLRATWNKATMAERDAFKAFIGFPASAAAHTPVPAGAPVKSPNNITSATPGKRHLPPALEAAVREIMDRRHLKNGDVMREIGRKPLNPSLGMALDRADTVGLHPGLEQRGDLVLKAPGHARCPNLHALGSRLVVAPAQGFYAAGLVKRDHGGDGAEDRGPGERAGVEVEVEVSEV